MLKKSGNLAHTLCIGALLSVFFYGYSLAQDGFHALDPASEPSAHLPSADPVSLDSVPHGGVVEENSASVPVSEPALEPVTEPTPVATASSSSTPSPSSIPYKFYEDYLDSILLYAKNILPGKQEFETQRALIKERGRTPKSQYEKQADYEKRVANFDKDKQKEIEVLEKKYKAEEKAKKDRLSSAINYKLDIQPEWNGILQPDTNVDGYNARIAKLQAKIAFMESKITNTMETLLNLEVMSKKDEETLDKKNRIYINRLKRAIELMQDYSLQEYAKVISSEKKKVEVILGEYDPESEKFVVNVNDYYSRTVPFKFVGFLNVKPSLAQEIDYKTDDFLTSISYINLPFAMGADKVYPGAVKADIFYKNMEISNTGVFQNVPGFENLDGYMDWAVRADSLISGKLEPRKLDSLYAMKSMLPKTPKSGTWWSRNKNIVRVTLFVATAVSTGIAIWQNNEAVKETDRASVYYDNMVKIIASQDLDPDSYNRYNIEKMGYDESVKAVRSSENMRNGFYIGAGVFGAASILSLCF
ncbi:MAG: hypothetical protein FWB90_01585 [Fibromonadales bacterium]|nr:hypothetical protein [Fibromonadales bacterium]